MKTIFEKFACLTKSIGSTSAIGLLVFCLFACLGVSEAAEETRNILILNSSMATEKYALAQAEFKARFKGANFVDIDLAKEEFDEAYVKKIIREKKPDVIYCIGSKAYVL